MPELFDLDRAFDALTHDVATHTSAPGAERATRAARRRRTTRLVGGVAALALVAGGGVGLLEHRGDPRVVDPANGLPAPQILTAAELDQVTAGWVSDWQEPTDARQLEGDYADPGSRCANRMTGGDDLTPEHVGAAMFVSGRSVAFIRGGETPSAADAERIMPVAGPIEGCTNVSRSAPDGDTELVTATATDRYGTAYFAVARWQGRAAFLGIASATPSNDPAIQEAVGVALLAALQDERTVTETSAVLRSAMTVTQSAEARPPSGMAETDAPVPRKKG